MKAVVARTGVNPATLRTWERRYQAVVPERHPSGTRGYSEETVHRVLLLKRVTEAGHAIRNVANLNTQQLEHLLSEMSVTPPPPQVEFGRRQVIAAALQDNLAEMERLIVTAAMAMEPRALVEQILVPLLEEVGQRWAAGTLSIGQEHAISASVVASLHALLRTHSGRATAGRPVLLATLPGERHELPLLMVRYVLSGMGTPVHYLGPDLPVEDIAHAAKSLHSPVVALSAVHDADMSAKREALRALMEMAPAGTEIWVGGRMRAEVMEGLPAQKARRVDSLESLEYLARLTGCAA